MDEINGLPPAEFYSSLGLSYETAFGHDAGLHNFITTALTYLSSASKILDIGCGTGKPLASTMAANGHSVEGIDISPEMIELSRQAVPSGKFEVANMLEYNNPKGSPDAIFNILSLFLLSREGMTTMTKKWAEWLEEKKGLLFICTMVAEDVTTDSSKYDTDGKCAPDVDFMFMGQKVGLTLFTREGWKDVLDEAGFEIVHIRTDLFSPPAVAKCDDEPHYFLIARKI